MAEIRPPHAALPNGESLQEKWEAIGISANVYKNLPRDIFQSTPLNFNIRHIILIIQISDLEALDTGLCVTHINVSLHVAPLFGAGW